MDNTEKQFKKTELIIAIIALILSIVAIVLPFALEIGFFTNNIITKAEGGNGKSQLILAEQYYLVGDYSQSIYWYKVASTSSNKKVKAKAYNNLAYSYSNGMGIENDEYLNSKKLHELAFYLYKQSADLGETTALYNQYVILFNNKDIFEEIKNFEYSTKLETVIQNLENTKFSDDIQNIEYGKWETVDTLRSTTPMSLYADENERLISGGKSLREVDPSNYLYITEHVYYRQTRETSLGILEEKRV